MCSNKSETIQCNVIKTALWISRDVVDDGVVVVVVVSRNVCQEICKHLSTLASCRSRHDRLCWSLAHTFSRLNSATTMTTTNRATWLMIHFSRGPLYILKLVLWVNTCHTLWFWIFSKINDTPKTFVFILKVFYSQNCELMLQTL